jgi:hypothetical protein
MKNQNGNVLFLILIAVALFAALSYAVTRSTRSGGSEVSREKADLAASALAQHVAGLRTAVTRMVMAGVRPDDLLFDCVGTATGSRAACSGPVASWNDLTASRLKDQVYYPGGGGIAAAGPLALGIDTDNDGYGGMYFFAGGMQVKGIGSDGAANCDACYETVLATYNVPKAICEAINRRAGLDGIPVAPSRVDFQIGEFVESGGVDTATILGDAETPGLHGREMGCLDMSAAHFPGTYGFYAVLYAR